MSQIPLVDLKAQHRQIADAMEHAVQPVRSKRRTQDGDRYAGKSEAGQIEQRVTSECLADHDRHGRVDEAAEQEERDAFGDPPPNLREGPAGAQPFGQEEGEVREREEGGDDRFHALSA